MDESRTVAVVGGGITGLAAAHALARQRPDFDTVLIEADRRLGGKLLTERTNGFVIEGGPDSFLASKPRGIELATELGLGGALQGTNPANRRTWIYSGGRLHPLPEGLSGLVPSRLEPLLESDLFTPAAKERLRQETDIPARAGDGDESVAAFVSRRFGPEVYERMIEPLMAGIYAGDGAQLSLAATFPQLRALELEYGSLLAGLRARAASPGADATPPSGFVAPFGGMGELVRALQRALVPISISTGTGVRRIERGGTGFRLHLEDGSTLQAAAVVLATPAYAAGSVLSALDGTLADTLCAIPHVSSATVSLAFAAEDAPAALEGYGYVVPRAEGRAVLACTCSSTKFEGRAPAGHVLLRVFVGRWGAEEALAGSDGDLVQLARAELREVLGVRAAPLLQRVFRWPRGMPQYTLGHLERLRSIEDRLAGHGGLFIAGNYLRGVGIPDCIAAGERAAAAATDYLGRA